MDNDPRVNFILSFFGQNLVKYSVRHTPMTRTSKFLNDVGAPRGKYFIGIHEDKRMGEVVFHTPYEDGERVYFAYIERFSKWRLYVDCSTENVRLSILSSSGAAEVSTEHYCSDLIVFLCQLAIFDSLKIDGYNFSVLARAINLLQFVDFESKLNIGLNLGLNNLIQLRGEIQELIAQQPYENEGAMIEITPPILRGKQDIDLVSRLLVPEYYKLLPILINFMELKGTDLSALALSTYISDFQQYDIERELEKQIWYDLLCSIVLHRNATPAIITAMTCHGESVVRATAMLALGTLVAEDRQGRSTSVQNQIYLIPEHYYVANPEISEPVRRLEQGLSRIILDRLMHSRA